MQKSAIIDEKGGIRTVTFEVSDSYGVAVPADFGATIDVNKTSSFTLSTSSDMNMAPGENTITFTIENEGNFEDTFTISSTSLNGWFSNVDPVTVAFE